MRIARQGFGYIGALAAAGLVLAPFPTTRMVALLPFALALFVIYFFRDPERTPPDDPRLLVSPADGRVVYVGPEENAPSGRTQISIFLSIFDVHINRSPIAGVITGLRYTPGQFLPAYRQQASKQNEQNEVTLTEGPLTVIVRQIAGVVARRIVFSKKRDERLERGERFGLIQFGSRVDILLPPEVKVLVSVGERVRGGESPVGEKT
jgi:phosphatidylserine decarboxylase